MPTTAATGLENVLISEIRVGLRRRKFVEGIASLARSIQAHGLIHPILLRNGNELVAGARRLAACEKLGMKWIPARCVDRMSDEELRAIEWDENAERQGLNDFDSSKARLAEIRQEEADQKREAEEELRSASPRNSQKGRGRPSQAGSQRRVAAVTGISPKSQREIASHVSLAEQYPALQRPGWVQHQVLHAGAVLEKLPEPDRPKAAALLDQEAIPPKTAIGILENLASLPAPDRKSIFKLAESQDEHERTTALTRAAALPDPVDPGLTVLAQAVDCAKKAARLCRAPEFKPRIAALADEASALLKDFDRWNDKQRGRV